MTEQPFVDPGHILPDEDWAKVVARAQEIRTEVQEAAGGGASRLGRRWASGPVRTSRCPAAPPSSWSFTPRSAR